MQTEDIVKLYTDDPMRIIANGVDRYLHLAQVEGTLQISEITSLVKRAIQFRDAFEAELKPGNGLVVGDKRQIVADYLNGDFQVIENLITMRFALKERQDDTDSLA